LLEERISYFSESFIFSSLKTFFYGFTAPYSFRKFLTKSNEYRSHVDALEHQIDERNENPLLKKDAENGDKIGYLAGLSGLGLYAYFALQNLEQNDARMIQAAILSNFLSFYYEMFRLGWKLADKTFKRKK
jgi:hypothetical protein